MNLAAEEEILFDVFWLKLVLVELLLESQRIAEMSEEQLKEILEPVRKLRANKKKKQQQEESGDESESKDEEEISMTTN